MANSIIQVDEQLEGARAWRLIPAVAVYVTFLKRDSSAPTVRLTKKRYCSACFVPDNLLGARSPVPTDQKLERVDFKRLCNQFGTQTLRWLCMATPGNTIVECINLCVTSSIMQLMGHNTRNRPACGHHLPFKLT